MAEVFDVVVVGAGPGGSAAALTAASAGLNVLMIERGEYVGAKNLTGGMLMSQVLEELIPEYWKDAPLQRPVEHHRIMMTSGERSLIVDIGNKKFLNPPYNGFSVLRREFDAWLAEKAKEAGAIVVTSTVVDDFLYEGEQVVGVKTRRPDGDIRAKVVIVADGVNSLLAQKAGLLKKIDKHNYFVGVKELLSLPAEKINERFGLTGTAGAIYTALGDFARGIPGGAFLYTNKESISIGVVVSPEALAKQKITADEVLEKFKAQDEIARLIEGSSLLEYSAHLIPEGGYKAMPKLCKGGAILVGDAAGMVVNTGLVLMGMNLAIASGKCAAETAIKACGTGDFSASVLEKDYTKALENCVVLSALKTHQKAPEFMSSPRMFDQYPDMINDMMEEMVTVGPGPRKGVMAISRSALKKIKLRDLARDGWLGVKSL